MATVDFTRIASNIAALNSLSSLRDVNANLALHQARLSTGHRINEAMDDPAGLTLATKLLRRSEGLNQAIDNIGDAKNLLSVAEGGLRKIQDILGKMRVKAEQAASDALGSAERTAIAGDLGQFAQEIDNIVDTTTWNGNTLLDTSVGTFNFQTSADTTSAGYTTWTQSTDHHVNGGVLSGLACITRPHFLAAALLQGFWLLYVVIKKEPRSWKRIAVPVAVYAFFAGLGPTSTFLYNVVVGGDKVLICANGGVTFCMGTGPAAVGYLAPVPDLAVEATYRAPRNRKRYPYHRRRRLPGPDCSY